MELASSVPHRQDRDHPRFGAIQPPAGASSTSTVTEWNLHSARFHGCSGTDRVADRTPRAMKDEMSAKASGAAPGSWHDQKRGLAAGVTKAGGEAEGATVGSATAETSQLDPRAPVRKGKWTQEEEMYTTRIINDFNKGLLPLAPGTTLRSYLSEKLNCDPMRITKKFAGASCIGKRVFMPAERTPENVIETHRSRRELEEMARKFHDRLEAMRPGASRAGGSSGAKAGASLAQSSPKTRRSTAQAAGVASSSDGRPDTCGGTTVPGGGGGGGGASSARRGDAGAAVRAADERSGGGASADGGSGRLSSRSPSPGAHGPHSACDDSAPHPEGSPGRRSSWERDEEGYGQYDPMDQSPSGDSENSSDRHSAPYAGGLVGEYAASGFGGSHGHGHAIRYARYSCDGSSDSGGGGEGHTDLCGPRGQPQQHHHESYHRHGARRSYNFHVGAGGQAGSGTSDSEHSQPSQCVEGRPGRVSPLSPTATRVSTWGSIGISSGSGISSAAGGEPRTLPPAALAGATVIRDGLGGGSGARSPTWPLPRVIPEGSEISDQDAGGLLIGFFRSVHEKVQTGSEELCDTSARTNQQPTAMHPLMASKRGLRSISSPALTQFAHYAEQLPRLQTPPFKRRKSVSSFV